MKIVQKFAAVMLMVSLLLPYAESIQSYNPGNPPPTVVKAATKAEEPEWNIECLNAENSYEESRKLKRIKVAVLDSGLDYDEDIPFVERKDFLGEEELHPLFQDYTGHGTSVASLICANKNDDSITGIAANVDLYVARILDENNAAPVSRVIEAVKWAMDKKVNIIHMSFGTKEYSQALYNVIQQAYNKNILIIASAGNDGTAAEDESTVEYPAAFSNVIAVGATNTENRKTEISSSGDELDIVAPGDQILSAGAFGGVVVDEGTSMAAAQVTGIAAVLWGKYPDKSNQFIRELLIRSANSSAVSGDCGNGMADYTKSVQNYRKMNTVYHTYKQLGTSETYAIYQAGKSIGKNTAPIEPHDDVNYVNGAWGKDIHEGFVTKKGIVTSSNINIVKKGVVAPDRLKKTKALSKHPYFHGGGNYLANTQYLYAVTRAYWKAQKEKLPTYKKVFDNGNPYKGVKKKYDIKDHLTT
ncbi:MAG: S8 family peptidase, partial [Lachnospiraceae bacterium]|nr:S8 family peptidase [Lachnospiraceae bacterium]